LKGSTTFGTSTNHAIAFDNSVLVTPSNSASTCNLGTVFKDGHVGVLSQVKYFVEGLTTSNFVNRTKFQGSNDGTTYTDIFTVNETIHEGWNYYKFEDSLKPRFRYYKFESDNSGGCAISEITFKGVETIDSETSTQTCAAKLKLFGTEHTLNTVDFVGSKTATLTAVSPRYGTVVGGTSVTFTGTDFSSTTSDYTITIDGINCPVSAATTTSVTCTTGSRPGLVATSLEILINGKGLVSNAGLTFLYVSVWSSDTTWGGEFAPMEMESVWIPAGLNLLVDVDSTPKLNAIIVEGSLIFAPDTDANHLRTFDAHYIFVNGGTMEVGTEEFPYTSKITITMYSGFSDPYIPIYGNKVIGVRNGILDMHGPTRTPVWTQLETTAEANATTITLQVAVDWQVGEEIAIASTSFDGRDADRCVIAAIDST